MELDTVTGFTLWTDGQHKTLRDLSFSRRWCFEIFWIVTPCSAVVGYQRYRGPHGDSMDLQNVDILPQHYTAS